MVTNASAFRMPMVSELSPCAREPIVLVFRFWQYLAHLSRKRQKAVQEVKIKFGQAVIDLERCPRRGSQEDRPDGLGLFRQTNRGVSDDWLCPQRSTKVACRVSKFDTMPAHEAGHFSSLLRLVGPLQPDLRKIHNTRVQMMPT